MHLATVVLIMPDILTLSRKTARVIVALGHNSPDSAIKPPRADPRARGEDARA
jgi:hypothetical protein